jgi:hypothetical protein
MTDEQERLSPAQFARRAGLSLSYVYLLLLGRQSICGQGRRRLAIPGKRVRTQASAP